MSVGATIQQLIVDEIGVLSIIADNQISVIAESKASPLNIMQIAQGVVRMAVIVRTTVFRRPNKNPVRGKPYFDDIGIQIEVTENRTLNAARTVHADDVAEEIFSALNGWDFSGQGNCIKLEDDAATLDGEWNNKENNLIWGWTILARTEGGLSLTIAQVATPSASFAAIQGDPANKTATITCATGGAGVFYTLDGSVPTPLRGTVYTAPFVAAIGATLRARAWLAGKTASDELRTTVA
jgi:hypothetical protein